jgi:hypothetical protein
VQLHTASDPIDTQQVLISNVIEDRLVMQVYLCREANALPRTHIHAHTA